MEKISYARRVTTHERSFRSWQEINLARCSSRSTTILLRSAWSMITCWIAVSTREFVGRAEEVVDESVECCEGAVCEGAVEVVE